MCHAISSRWAQLTRALTWALIQACGYRDGGMTVYLPAHIYVGKCITLGDAMRACETPQETLHELFTICQNLTQLLQMQHRRSIVLRDINVRNVVKASFGISRTWTLLEYCNASRAGLKSDYLPAWSTPPEVRCFGLDVSTMLRSWRQQRACVRLSCGIAVYG